MNKNFTIEHARSKLNGIIFYSNITPMVGYKTFLDENGEIQKDITLSTIDDCDSIEILHFSNEKKLFKKWMVFTFLGFLISFGAIASICLKAPGPFISSLYFCSFALYEIFRMINFSHITKIKDENNYSLAKFHAAEHMAINAYRKLEHIPTLEEIKSFSRFSKDCGSMKSLNKISFFSIFSILLIIWSKPIFIPLAIFYFTFIFLATKIGLFRFLQILVTSKPTDKELLVAIEGLKFYEEMEEFKQKIASLRESTDAQTP